MSQNQKKKLKEETKKKQLERREKLLKAKWGNKRDDEESKGDDKKEHAPQQPIEAPQKKPPAISRPAKAIEMAKEVAKDVAGKGKDDEDENAPANDSDGKLVKILSAEEADASGSRLSQHKKGSGKVVGPRDFADWKKKNGVQEGQKVFCLTGWYPCVKDDLVERGWFRNEDPDSPFFDLKWMLRSSDSRIARFQPWQLTNHFLKNTAITTKAGLMKSLRNLTWFASVSEDNIFPRGYDLTSPDELRDFLDDYRCLRAESLLKLILVQGEG